MPVDTRPPNPSPLCERLQRGGSSAALALDLDLRSPGGSEGFLWGEAEESSGGGGVRDSSGGLPPALPPPGGL